VLSGLLTEVAQACGGRLLGADAAFAGVSADTRRLARGNLFVALTGPRFDGNDLLGEAAAAGAAGAVTLRAGSPHLPVVQVADTLAGLHDLARLARERFPGRVVGITGSNGKTTVKELTAACLARRGSTLATEGNLNNAIGVPLTLCRLDASHRHAVIEMGAGGLGEIAPLAALARPHVAVVTCCAPAHLEGFGSIEGVARTKGEIFAALPADGVAVVNGEDAWAGYWRGIIGARPMLSFGLDAHFDVHCRGLRLHATGADFELVLPDGRAPVRLALLGRHNVLNALAAAAAAHALGLTAAECAAGLARARPVAGRLQRLTRRDGGVLIDDSYNANPASLESAARTACAGDAKVWVVLGDMAELGPEAEALHLEAGKLLSRLGVERLFGIGPLAGHACDGFGVNASRHASLDELHARLADELRPATLLLVKGSRSAGLERLVRRMAMTEGN
jgi:UDP-N-acetylmuramoyl-tripeptide--D-alanyl-D-alanine ligase